MIECFTDPVMRAPTWGSILMCVSASLMGVLIFFRKKSLLAETLSHATYPGACLGIALFALLFPNQEQWCFFGVILGAFLSSMLGLKAVNWLETKGKVPSDAALCFVLAVFFGVGIVIASGMQSAIPVWYKQVQMLLFGQTATMTDFHVWLYSVLTLSVTFFITFFFRPIQAYLFDPNFSKSIHLRVGFIERGIFWLLLFSLILGIRSVGVVLMSGMVIAPAVAARCFFDRLQTVLISAAFFGAASGFLGNYFSASFLIPTGPLIVLIGSGFAFFGLLFSFKRGLFFRLIRMGSFRLRCVEENILKAIWKRGEFRESPSMILHFALWRLKRGGWIDRFHQLTEDGKTKAAMIVRLHRLFELYLTEELGLSLEKVHKTAEEMEHILTPEMEKRLTRLLEDPKTDPHQQPIPKRGDYE